MPDIRQGASALAGRHAPALKRLVPPAQRTRAWALFYRALPAAGKASTLARRTRGMAGFCERQGSPLYAHLLRVAADDLDARGACWRALQEYASRASPPPPAFGLAFMAAVHRVVLETPGNALEAFYPSVGGTADIERVGPAFLEVVDRHRTRIGELMQAEVQTNEVARSRVLLGGFLLAARAMQLPLRVLEFGASAGLNLRWDHYRYEIGGATWGDPGSPVRLTDGFVEGAPPLGLTAEVAERRGCDLAPIDPRSPDGQHKLISHVWADQLDRVERLRAAFEVAAHVDAPVDQGDAPAWVAEMLREPVPGRATVIFDTCMMEYLDASAREDIHRTIGAAGARATPEHPLAWLHLAPGPPGGEEELHLTTWPGGERLLLATCDPYARQARWKGPAA